VQRHLGGGFGTGLKTMCRQTLRTEGPAAGTPALSCRQLPFLLSPFSPQPSLFFQGALNSNQIGRCPLRTSAARPAADLPLACTRVADLRRPGYVRAVVRHGLGRLVPRTQSDARGVRRRAISRSCTYRIGAGSAIPPLVICTIQSLSRLMAIRVGRRRWHLRLNARSISR
jgi:hypothetical protein